MYMVNSIARYLPGRNSAQYIEQWTVLRSIEQSVESFAQYRAVSGQCRAILSSQWTAMPNIEQSVVRIAQYLAVSG
jgi:hypothetical protein